MLQGIFTASSALKAHQHALDVTSNNIANQNTEGYTKQRVNFHDNPIKDTQSASATIKMGTGVHVQSVIRIEDTMLYDRLNQSKNRFEEDKISFNSLDEVSTGSKDFTDMYNAFFESLHRYVDMPHNMELQYLAQEQAKALTERSNQLQEVFNRVRISNEKKMEALTATVEPLQVELERLEKQIVLEEAGNEHSEDKTYANALRDSRDLIKTELGVTEHKIKGYEQSTKDITELQNLFKDNFNNTYQNINQYLETSQTGTDAKELLSKEGKIKSDFNDIFVGMENIKNTAGRMMGSSEYIITALQNKDDNISKVNLDEEMVNMMKYQKAYEANAIVIKTMDEILQTTLDLKR